MESKRFLFSLLIVVLISVTTSAGAHVGGYKRIKDPLNPYVVEIAKFAVKEHNKDASKSKQLALVGVVSGQKQVVSGTNYKLYMRAKVTDVHKSEVNVRPIVGEGARGGCVVKVYEAVVYDKPSTKHRSLTSFKEWQKKN